MRKVVFYAPGLVATIEHSLLCAACTEFVEVFMGFLFLQIPCVTIGVIALLRYITYLFKLFLYPI